MIKSNTIILVSSLAALTALGNTCGNTVSAQNTKCELDPGVAITTAEAAGAQAQNRMLDATQLSPRVLEVLGLDPDVLAAQGSGSANHPFTTKRASSENDATPVGEAPWRATGKMFMKFGSSTFVCTASVIEKGLLVTAAHCVHNFGGGAAGCADSITFEPARHESSRPFGSWTAKEAWVPRTYFNGDDVCSSEAPGIVCENDVAVVVLQQRDGNSIVDVTGKYGYPKNDNEDDFGYTDFLDQKAGQITQLGYPSDNYDGDKMIRTDSLGYWDDPFNVIIGSNQTGGSSGGPWLMNFGTETSSFSGTAPIDNESSQVVATTSWGFTLDTIKVQGASRFSKNTAYTEKSNIESLVESACAANADAC